MTQGERTKLGNELKRAYEKGKSIRELRDDHGRSYGFVRSLLAESGTTFRGRGNPGKNLERTMGSVAVAHLVDSGVGNKA